MRQYDDGPYTKLLEPGMIKGVHLKNRAVSAPMGTEYAQRDGTVNERLLKYYEEKAKGGAGLVIVEYAYIDQKASMAILCQLGAYDNACIAGLSRLSEVMQCHGAKTCLQIVHCGATKYDTLPAVAPSRAPYEEVPELKTDTPPAELTLEDIQEIIDAFGNAARIAKQAGFDMLEIHGAHGYLITEFLSPLTNRRKDRYGGSLRNRMRFALDVARKVIETVGPDYPVGIRLSGTEYQEGAVTIEDTIPLCQELEKLGIAYIHISGGNGVTLEAQAAPSYLPAANQVWAAETVKKAVKVPVIASGSLNSPELAENVLKEGKADFVSFGRPLLADPYFAAKLTEGRPEDIRPCIRCNVGCMGKGTIDKRGLMCSVNIALGREERLHPEAPAPARQPKRVVVVGGGPGGMEAARIAALRGHSVTLFERRERLGGALIEAAIPKFKRDLLPLNDYLSTQVKKLGVTVNLGKEVTLEEVMRAAPDAVIAATGASPVVPRVPGMGKPHVSLGLDVLKGARVGNTVLLVGGGQVSCEVAWFLLQMGKQVIMTTRQAEIAYDMELVHGNVMKDVLAKANIRVYTGVALNRITDDGAIVTGADGPTAIAADSVVVNAGFTPNAQLGEMLSSRGVKCLAVGDCVKPRGIHEAIYEGHLAALAI